MLPEIRKQAQVEAPNNSESINHVIRKEREWIASTFQTAISERQNADYQKAVISRGEWKLISISRGEWKLISCFKHLEVLEGDWFRRTQQQKVDHIKRVMTMKPVLQSKTKVICCESHDPTSRNVLDVDFESVAITRDTLKSIWKKANDLVLSTTYIIIPTWSKNPKARLVKSTSSDVPHFYGGGQNSSLLSLTLVVVL